MSHTPTPIPGEDAQAAPEAQLYDEIEALRGELEQLRADSLRERADLENQRKRLARDVEQARRFATALTTWLGEHAGAQGLGTGAAVLVLALAAAKGCLIILDYMELRHAPALWRRLLLGWLAAVVLLVLAATLWPR